MPIVRVHNFFLSLDGYGTGEGRSVQAPFGHAGARLVEWYKPTHTFQQMMGNRAGSRGVDHAFANQYTLGFGAEIMGRGKFSPHEGGIPADWRGWWGDDPPFHTPVFVLTHHPREPLVMKGGTTFHFLDASPREALARAQEAAGDRDVRIGGGPSTVRAFLAEDLIDHMHVAMVPVVLGRGERLWDGLEGLEDRFAVEAVASPSGVTHLTFTRKPRG